MAIDPASSEHDLSVHLLEHNYPVERETMADVSASLAQVASVHGARHPELRHLEGVWAELCRCLTRHLRDERPILAPLADAESCSSPRNASTSSAIASQHAEIVALVRRVRELTGGYSAPADACDAYRSMLASLTAFDEDLRQHVEIAERLLSGEEALQRPR